MTWLQQQTDSNHLNLLHLINSKQCVLEKCSDQLQQIALNDGSGCRLL
jgi:hypothetical protein